MVAATRQRPIMENKKRFYRRPWFWVALILVAMALVSAGFFRGSNGSATLKVYPGSDIAALEDSLATSSGDASFSKHTAFLLRLSGVEIKDRAGLYAFERGTTPIDAARRVYRHAQTPVKVTFNNIRTMQQLADRLDKQLLMSADDFLAATGDTITTAMFIPDTYEFYWNVAPETLIRRLRGYHDKWWNDKRMEAAQRLGLTPDEVAVIASIVEEETAKSDERGKVARLYINRLRKGMPLQADPTVKFAIGDFSLRRIGAKHLAVESPYNTYRHTGLPPTPIRIAEKSALEAVLNAPEHNYLYMCAREDFSGYHNFTASFAEHRRNAFRYRAALDARGIK